MRAVETLDIDSYDTCIRPLYLTMPATKEDVSTAVIINSPLDPPSSFTSTKSCIRLMAQPSRLLALPAELRLEIWEYALTEPYRLGIGGFYSSPHASTPKIFGGDAAKPGHQPPLALVSRQVRHETLALFYRFNRFVLAVHYRKARREVDRFLDKAATDQVIIDNLWNVTFKHRFGMLDFRGTIDLDVKDWRIFGPHLWYNSIPPTFNKQVERIVAEAKQRLMGGEERGIVLVSSLRALVDILGAES